MPRMRLLAALLLPILLAACSSPVAEPLVEKEPVQAVAEPAVDQATGMTTIRVAVRETYLFNRLLPGYHEANPGDRVVLVPLTSMYPTDETIRKIEAGAVDLVLSEIPVLVERGLVMPLDPLIQRDQFDLEALGFGVEPMRIDGKLYQLPYMLSWEALYYNKEHFQTAGAEEPQPGWSWEQFRQAAAQTARGESADRIWGFTAASETDLRNRYLYRPGISMEEQLHNKQAVREMLQFFGTIYQSDKSMAPLEHPMDGPGAFFAGRSAMNFYRTSTLNLGRDWPFAYGVAPLPGTGRGMIHVFPETLAIAHNTEVADAAWRFLRYMAGPEAAKVIAKGGNLPVYRTDDLKRLSLEHLPTQPALVEMLYAADWVPRGVGRPALPSRDAIRAVDRALKDALTGKATWEEAFAAYQQAMTGK